MIKKVAGYNIKIFLNQLHSWTPAITDRVLTSGSGFVDIRFVIMPLSYTYITSTLLYLSNISKLKYLFKERKSYIMRNLGWVL